MTYTASLHLGAIELRWLHLCQKTLFMNNVKVLKKKCERLAGLCVQGVFLLPSGNHQDVFSH